MVEEKSNKKSDNKQSHKEHEKAVFLEVFALILFVFLFVRLVYIYSSNNGISTTFLTFIKSFKLLDLFHQITFYLIPAAAFISILFITGIVYLLVRLREIEKTWLAALRPSPASVPEQAVKNEKWQRIIVHIGSDAASDWRLAILECDILLDNLFDKLGYIGNTIGDKLKNVDPAHFKTLDNAWEAHKIRNAIAHQGQDFTLTNREARRVVGLYESVFLEFDFI